LSQITQVGLIDKRCVIVYAKGL